ncbi:eae-like domain protein [Escherichia coli]
MHSNNNELVKAGHDLAKALSADAPLTEIAKMITSLATQLDVTTAALRAMTKKRDAEHSDVIAWEKTMFKVCGEDGIASVADKFIAMQSERDHLAAQLADVVAENAALKALNEDRRVFIMNGVQLGYIKVPTVETDPALETIRIAVSPQEKTPVTDRFLAEQRAVGVDMAIDSLLSVDTVASTGDVKFVMQQFAAQLRNEVKG